MVLIYFFFKVINIFFDIIFKNIDLYLLKKKKNDPNFSLSSGTKQIKCKKLSKINKCCNVYKTPMEDYYNTRNS